MSYKDRALGALVSPHDRRDYTLAKVGQKVLTAFPDEYPGGSVERWKSIVPPNAPYDQDIFGMCVAFGLALTISIQEHSERDAWEDYSAGYIYGWREPGDHNGEGMYPREALANLQRRGVPPRIEFPMLGNYPTLKTLLEPHKDQLQRIGLPQKIKSYVALQTVDEIKTALLTLGPCPISIPVYDSFYQGGHLPLPNMMTETYRGGHLMAIIGWTRDNRWIIANSWGKRWGALQGFCTVPFGYPANEIWAVTDLAPTSPTVRMQIGSTRMRIGDREYTMRVPPTLIPDPNDPGYSITMIPLREAGQALGVAVDWSDGHIILTPPTS